MKAATLSKQDLDAAIAISIHAAREGGDFGDVWVRIPIPISIHAAREGGDVLPRDGVARTGHFNPRRP